MTTENRAEVQAIAQLASILEWAQLRDAAQAAGDDAEYERLSCIPNDDVLDVAVRSDWGVPGMSPPASEFFLLLCTGGPAVRMIGKLDEHGYPDAETLRIEYQDWGTPWEPLNLRDHKPDHLALSDVHAAMADYASSFYYKD